MDGIKELDELKAMIHTKTFEEDPTLTSITVDDVPDWWDTIVRKDAEGGFAVETGTEQEWVDGLALVLAVGEWHDPDEDGLDAAETYCDCVGDPSDFDEMCNLLIMADRGELGYIPYGYNVGSPRENFGLHMAQVNDLAGSLAKVEDGEKLAGCIDYEKYGHDYAYDMGLGERGYIDMSGNYPMLDKYSHDEILSEAGIYDIDEQEIG